MINIERSPARATLQDLTAKAQASAEAPVTAQINELPESIADRDWGWWRFLSSLAKTEGLEDLAMEGLDRGFARYGLAEPWLLDYVASHRQDEHRHGEILKSYIRSRFGDRPGYRSWSDVFLYGLGFRVLRIINRRDPLYLLVILMMYEKASLEFYRQAIVLCEEQGKPWLAEILQGIRRDEARHLTGVTTLIKLLTSMKPVKGMRRLFVRFWGRVTLADLDYSDGAFYNSGLRRAFGFIGFDREDFTRRMRENLRQIVSLATSSSDPQPS